MINSRAKGASGEREFCAVVKAHTGIILQRKLDQTRGGGHDLECKFPTDVELWPFAVEVKRGNTAGAKRVLAWWKQCLAQAASSGLEPMLAWRLDHQKWNISILDAEIGVRTFDAIEFLTQVKKANDGRRLTPKS